MRKYVGLFVIFVLIIIMGFAIGLYIYRTENIKIETAEKQNTINNKIDKIVNTIAIETTSNQEDKISVNTKIIQKKYYIDCEHLIETEIKEKEKYINMTKSKLQIEFIDWTIQRFTNNEVVLYKEIHDFCNEHYLACDEYGYIVIYQLDKKGLKKEKILSTGIATELLSEEDANRLKAGIEISSKKEYNRFLEDFDN